MKAMTVRSGEVSLAVFEAGDTSAPTVVLVHGYPDTHTVWDGVVAELAGHFHVVAYDVRGAGDSTAPSSRKGYRFEHLVADLGAVIDAVSADRPVHLVGHDWGSIAGWEAVTCGTLDGRIASYTSISGPSIDHVGAWFRKRLKERRFGVAARQLLHSWYVAAFQLPGAGRLVGRGAPRMWPRALERLEHVPNAADEIAPTVASDFRNGRELYVANMLPTLRRPDVRPTDVPVLLIVLDRDRYVTPALLDGLEELAPNMVRAHVDGGHWSVRTKPTEIARLITEFTTRRAGAG